jgi:CO/xanthine dehydrogenase Mo-binding subunit
MSGTSPIAGGDSGWNSSSSGGVAESGRGMGGAQIAKPGIEIGDPCNVNGVCVSGAEVAVDTDTGEVEILGYWNCIDTGRTVFKQGTLKEIGSGCELQIAQCMYYGDIYDQATGACIASNYTEAMFPTPKDYKTERFVLQDWQSNEAAGAFGAKGMAEPCVSNYVAIINAIFNATGKWVDPDKGPVTADKVLKALGKA